MKYQKIVPIGISLLMVVLHSFLLTPNYDDGFNAYFISNTIDFVNPFFSDYFNTRFVVLKIPVLIMALGFTYLFPFSFAFPSALYGMLCILCSFLSYKVARLYSNSKTALLCSQLFLYFLLTHDWVCPTRFELWLLSVMLVVIYLFELYNKNRKSKYLILISLFVGIFGLPLHSNASILYVFLIGYLVFNRNIFSIKELGIFLISLAITSIVGMAIVVFPDPVESIGFLKRMSMESGNRFIPNIINLSRYLFFINTYYLRYLLGFFVLFTGMWVIENWKEFYQSIPYYIRLHKNIFIFFISVFIAIEILPAGSWNIYFTYYFFPICFLMSKLFFLKISSKGRYIVLLILMLALIRFVVVHINLSDLMKPLTLFKLLLFYVPIITIVYFNKIKLNLLYVLIFFGLGLKIFYQYHNWQVYNEVGEIYESHIDQPIIASAEFNWIDRSNTNYGFAPFLRNSNPSDLNSGLVIFGETQASRAYPVSTFLDSCSDCNFDLIGEISSSFNVFVGNKFMGLKVYRYSGFNVINSPFNNKTD